MGDLKSTNAICAIGLLLPSMLVAQSPTKSGAGSPEPIAELYQQVMDTAFPSPPEIGRDIVLTMSIRISEAFGGVSQINVTLYASKSPEVEYLVTGNDLSRVFAEATRSGGNTSAPSLLKLSMVNRKPIKVPVARVFEWEHELFRDWAATFPTFSEHTNDLYRGRPTTVMVDANTYEISYAQLKTRMHGIFFGSKGEPAIAKWAEDIRDEVVRIAHESASSSEIEGIQIYR